MNKFILPRIIAHRGASGYAPENTLAAMTLAKKLGVKWVEFDVMLSGCGEPIIIHDFSLKRTTSIRGKVNKYSFEQICQFDAGSWFSPKYKDEYIPSLKQMLVLLKKINLSAVIEIKPFPGQEKITAKKTYEKVAEITHDHLEKFIFSSFSLESLQTLRKLDEKILLGLGLHRWSKDWYKNFKTLKCSTVHINHLILTPKRMQDLKMQHAYIIAYTVNNARRAKELFQWGVDGIFSDFPDHFITENKK